MALQMQQGRPANRELFAEALDAVPEVFAKEDLMRWFEASAPWVDPLWVEGRLVGDTVNDLGRQHVPSPRDLVFLRADGRYERYDQSRHGRWSSVGTPVLLPAERPSPDGSRLRRRFGFPRRHAAA
jgi:hypothetical protein